jgi:hypothetical protein
MEVALASLLHHFDWSLPGGVSPGDLDMGEGPRARRGAACPSPPCKTPTPETPGQARV